ncbi:hypothetical protein H7H37_10880, partial [Mycolicibacterium insubricum]|nr:hypothetical protein [Mycolicibacterium insubricum]
MRAELQRGAQAFIVEPDEYGEWATALADVPNKAVIDMAGGDFARRAAHLPERVAGSYWLDYMIPMLGLDVRSVAVGRLPHPADPRRPRRAGAEQHGSAHALHPRHPSPPRAAEDTPITTSHPTGPRHLRPVLLR